MAKPKRKPLADDNVQGEPKRRKTHRGTRGRGDPRNGFMRRQRVAHALQRKEEERKEEDLAIVSVANEPAPVNSYPSSASPPSSHDRVPASSVVAPWTTWDTVAVNLFNLPEEANTFLVWQAFNGEGRIFSIDLFEDNSGKRTRKGKVRFRPPPQTDFWRTGQYRIVLSGGREVNIIVHLDLQNKQFQVLSPLQSNVRYPAEIAVPIVGLNLGILQDEETMLSLRPIGDGLRQSPRVVLNLSRRELVVFFQLGIFNNRRTEKAVEDTFHEYRLRVPFAQLTRLLQKRDNSSEFISHIITLDAPPIYHRRLKDLSSTFSVRESSWRDEDAWFRQTDIVHVPEELTRLPISLRKHKAIINIGRWTTIRINYPRNVDKGENFTLLCRVLRDFNVDIDDCDDFSCRTPNISPVPIIWDIIDPAPESEKTSFLDDLKSDEYLHLPFSVRYQLEVCLSHGYISEYAASKGFVEKLLAMGEKKAKILLEHIATEKKIYYDPMAIFDLKFVKGATTGKIPSYCCYMRSATITPSTVYYNTPSVDISNRVIRRFIEYSDRFLRVRFKDEKLEGRINSTERNTMDEVFTRIKRTMTNGVTLGDRHYEFLAFGNSQFREHGAYFFASLPNLTAANIRAWMGQFEDIKNIAKYAARLGQCFSTTRAVTGCAVQVREIDDVVRNGYTFSDGVGRVSRFLAQMAANELKIKTPDREPPSAFQFRLGGRKGMLVVSSEAQRQEIHIRPSQHKFPAGHNGLEIIRWSQFSMASLNRQLIIVLSSLGVSDEIFHDRLRMMLANLDEAMTSEARAVHLLQKYVDPNQMTLFISQMVKDGFQKSREPFVTSLLALWRAWQIKYLKEKAKIVIDSGACLLGVMDETGTLKGYSHSRIPNRNASYEEKVSALPEIFLQISRADQGGKYQVIEGICILARNPSLHPGDIRVVKAVNVPQLRHLKDVVVLPQLGDRDISSMCSGGDLDGDDYLVIWDKDLLPNDWFRKPMDYTATKAKDLDRPVTVNDVTSFFVTYMKNDCLPRIAHAHLAWADWLHGGVEENKCMRLAKLHSDAVDYNKTGTPAKMTRELRPRMWPHFMEKKHQPKDRIYKSHKILGQLYDSVERVDFVPNLEMPFDQRILNCEIKVDEDLVHFAKHLKHTYDLAVRRIMAQHEIGTEFEIWSTFVLSHANVSKDYKFHEELGGISSSLRDRFRNECYDKVAGRQFERLAPLAVAMYRVTCNEVTVALAEFHKDHPAGASKVRLNPDKLPLISFPWILPDILGKIASGYYDEKDEALVGRGNKGQQLENQCQMTPENPSGSDESVMEGEIVVLSGNGGAGITTTVAHRAEDSFEVDDDAKDIVEEEGDVKPSALDMLEDLLEDSDED